MKLSRFDFKIVKQQVDNLAVDKTTKFGLRLLFLSLGLSLLWLAGWWHRLPPEIPLLYSRPYGEGRLVSQWNLWLLPTASFFINLISIKIAGNLIKTDKLLAQILILSGMIANIMALITLIRIILLII